MQIKGKSKPYQLYEVLWGDEGNYTTFISPAPSVPTANSNRSPIVILNYQGVEYSLTEDQFELTIGRTPDCRIQVQSSAVSRSHLTIKFHQGKILLQDHSTNGTYIGTHTESGLLSGQDMYLHREDWSMTGKGVLGIGEPIVENNPFLIYFTCLRESG